MFPPRTTLPQRLKQFFSAVTQSFRCRKVRRKHIRSEPIVYQLEAYCPRQERDDTDRGGRYESLSELCARVGYQLPIQVVKLIARDVLRELQILHEESGVAHGDLNTNNIFLSPRDMRSLVSQLSADIQESFTPSDKLSIDDVLLDFNSMLTSTSSTVFKLYNVELDALGLSGLSDNRSLRPPEVILGAPHGTSADLWSLGCILYELLTGESLFDPYFQTHDLGLSPDESHLIQIIELLGELPQDVLSAGEYSERWFNQDGTLRIETTLYPVSLETILRSQVEEDDFEDAYNFFNNLLQLNPEERAKPYETVNHVWFMN
ncbi:kinase-like domain-containing protein [Collybia nuda]|uniref:non-specific serine/threonine protein kinase n=1 Tax=Collybia nuda TaxID=64659 RepID=A0A9P6CFD8_9AGAR|nr:kinase-like domain-containing protein [Collybia nuda]